MERERHYQNMLARIQTREDFFHEMTEKLIAIKESGYPIPIEERKINELVCLLSLDTIGKPPFWPPTKENDDVQDQSNQR